MLPNEVRRADIDQLTGGNKGGAGTYDDLFAEKQFVIVDEAKADEPSAQFKAYENLKQTIDTSPVRRRVNPKYAATYETDLLFNFLGFSNNIDALRIPADDRRFCVLQNPQFAHGDPVYYDRLYEALDDRSFLAATYWYLRRFDWSGVNPRKPLKTALKTQMIDATKSPREMLEDEVKTNMTVPDIMSRKMLEDLVKKAAYRINVDTSQHGQVIRSAVNRLWSAMHDAPWKQGDTDKRFRPRINDAPTHIKAWRSDLTWPSENSDWGKVLQSQATI